MARVYNHDVAEALGLHHSMVSRIRGGSRRPSIETMDRVRELTGWSMDAQMRARNDGSYAEQFDVRTTAALAARDA